MDAAGLARATLLGISGGAATAIAYAARRRSGVEKLSSTRQLRHGVARREPGTPPLEC